jgi:hypothetical protein
MTAELSSQNSASLKARADRWGCTLEEAAELLIIHGLKAETERTGKQYTPHKIEPFPIT